MCATGSPGHMFAYYTANNFFSVNGGMSWTNGPIIPDSNDDTRFFLAGLEPQECWLLRVPSSPENLLYHTGDDWESYVQLPVSNVGPDSSHVSVEIISHWPGLIYGIATQPSRVCVSSDTGRTWSTGGWPSARYITRWECGAHDELWGMSQFRLYVVTDTGRTVRDSLFIPNLPLRPLGWERALIPTINEGEVYVSFKAESPQQDGVRVELVFYHIREYGALVDSFYHELWDFRTSVSNEFEPVPESFAMSVFPNPFNSTLSISLDVPLHWDVTLSLYDLLGREVDVVYRGRLASSTISYVAPAALSSGVYFLRAAGERSVLKKVVLLK